MRRAIVNGIDVEIAHTFFERTKGLIGRSSLPVGQGLLIERCNAIHTCFMSFPIDAMFLDKDFRVVKIVKGIKPWRFLVWGGWRASMVLETRAS